jgi:imidazolonepropionase
MITQDILITNATILTINKNNDIYNEGAIYIKNGLIQKIYKNNNFEKNIYLKKYITHINAHGKLITPGLIDCHSHVIYGGNRINDFCARINKSSIYSKEGILSTIDHTRKESFDNLLNSSLHRINNMLVHGTTTLEIKSGYGLNLIDEIKMLNVATYINNNNLLPISITKTFLGAHTCPKEFTNNNDYIDYIINNVLPIIFEKKLANFVDIFCENIGFNINETEKLIIAALKYNFKIKMHAEQFSNIGGSILAAKYGAFSIDHLEYLTTEDCKFIANQKKVPIAVLLPGAFYFLKEKKLPPIKGLIDNNIDIAIATDANPGSSPFFALPMIMNMACVLFGINVDNIFKSVTINAAKALDMDDTIGSIEINKKADLIIWNTNDYREIIYNPLINFCNIIIKNGIPWYVQNNKLSQFK